MKNDSLHAIVNMNPLLAGFMASESSSVLGYWHDRSFFSVVFSLWLAKVVNFLYICTKKSALIKAI